MIRKPKPRRGVVILVVLSLLVLFVLLVVTFSIVAGQYRRAAQAHARKEWLGEDPQKIADRVMYALLREPRPEQTGAPFRGHSLLGDVYTGSTGTTYGAWIRGAVSGTVNSLAGGQIIEFNVPSNPDLQQLAGYYNGNVLTFTSGGLQNTSTRVVGYRYTAGPPAVHTFRIMPPEVPGPTPLSPSSGDTFVLNSKPFVGTGFGYNSTAAPGDPRLTEEALKPNRTGDNAAALASFLAGGANESYDAPDYQNMIMAAVTADGVLPSFHRPELVQYWIARESTSSPNRWDPLASPGDAPANWTHADYPGYRDFRRRLIFRPMPWDHPNFTGSNLAFDGAVHSANEIVGALMNGPWDVDNDGDGIKDSIWIDPDLPIQTTEDGRTYKPLVAILCVDMDGRVNLNAQGHYGHLAGVLAGYPQPQPVGLAGGMTSQALPKGYGYGPPEIDLNRLISDNTQYQVLLQTRYGANQQPGRTGYDPLMQFKFFEYPGNYFAPFRNTWYTANNQQWQWQRTDGTWSSQLAYLSSFSSNMDVRGLFACGVDYRGQPLYETIYEYDDSTTPPTFRFPNLLRESPYEFNLNRHSAADAPFTVGELEKVLRYSDYDRGSLQSRLTDTGTLTFLQGTTTTAQAARRAVTTDSWDIPVPGVVAPDAFNLSLPPQTIMDLLAARLQANGFSGTALDDEISKLFAIDLIMGLRMDINRPIGNGRDDNGNMVVDEAYGVLNLANMNESLGPEYAMVDNTGQTSPVMVIDHDNDGVISNDANAYLARSYLARHLYVLMMLLIDRDFTFDIDVNGDGVVDAEDTAQILAQWAINAVDFRDANSIMTAFEYDVNPFNGWNVDGILGSADDSHPDRRVVWGCERPELLITQTLAFHDVRTEDLEDPGNFIAEGDPHPDQRLMPRGSLFVELYNPWSGHDNPPGEFYHNGTNWNAGVLLNRRNSAGQPVWRLAVTDSGAADALHPNPRTLATPAPERTVYFTNPSGLAADIPLGPHMHFTNVTGIAPLLPGRYAVVGSGGVVTGGEYVTTIGRRADAGETDNGGTLGLDRTRQIVLSPNINPDTLQVQVRNNRNPPLTQADAVTVDDPQPPTIQPAIAIPINVIPTGTGNKGKGKGMGPPPEVVSLSISEPLGGYLDEVGGSIFNYDLADGEGAYEPPLDKPLDWDTLLQEGAVAPNTTLPDHRWIHLQRLANPLAPYHATTNPYLTIDVMPVDLTVFSGVESADGATRFGAFERGSDAPGERQLWRQPPTAQSPPVPAPLGDGGIHIFGYQLRHTLGYLNSSYGNGFTNADAPAQAVFTSTSYVGAPDSSGSPFPWLAWNNRPYTSPMELLLVPPFHSAGLLRNFSLADTSVSTYDPAEQGRFHHLLNFFAARPNVNNSNAPNLYRIFEYLTVRPRFVGTETLLNPSISSPHFGSDATGTEMLHPPFNRISTYREPGRINLNTIYDPRVWNALWGSPAPPMTFDDFDDFVDSRRGYPGAGIFAANPDSPTFFANPFRAPGTSLLIPPDAGGGTDLGRLEIDTTLLRSNRNTMGVTAPSAGDEPGFLNSLADAARNSDRNAFFSYQTLQRLPNLVTTRSNVYALWITVGYFEVESNGTLGQEVGLDTGTVQRNRAFYIIDRSIPVAFEPGQNHNVDKCVLVRRFIE